MTQVIGLDLSLTATGIACPDHVDVLDPPDRVGKSMGRLAWIRNEILEHFPLDTDYLAVIEGYSRNSPFRREEAGELGGLIRWTLWTHDIPYLDVAPSTLKLFATGNGRATKDQVLTAACRHGYGGDNNNSADAFWLRAIGLYLLGEHRAPQTAYRDKALAKFRLPEGLAA